MKSGQWISFIQKIMYLMIVVLCVARFVMNNELSVLGRMVTEAEIREGHFVRENALIEQHIAQAASLATISKKALDMGFIAPTDIAYFSDAFLRRIAVR